MVANTSKLERIETNENDIIKNIVIKLALFLRNASDYLCAKIDHTIDATYTPSEKPYTGPTYGKIANKTRHLIAGKVAHEQGYTGNTGWLYITIASLINRKTNILEISINDLMLETGLSRPAIITHTKLLEKLELLQVSRESTSPTSNEINIYNLAGEGAQVTLWNGSKKNIATPKPESKILTTPVKNTDGKDSLQTNPKQHAADAVNNKKQSLEEIELSPQQQTAVNALKSIRIAPKTARELTIAYQDNDEYERLFATIKCAKDSNTIKNPPGFVRSEITKNEQGLSWEIVSNGWQSLSSFKRQYMPKDYNEEEQPPDEQRIPPPKIDKPMDKPAGPELPPLPEVDPKAKEQWSIAYNQLELQFDRATFDTWLRGAQIIDREDNGVFVIGVRNGYVRDMLQHRLYRNIRRVLGDVCAQPVELRFIICHQLNETEKDDGKMPLFRILAQEAQ